MTVLTFINGMERFNAHVWSEVEQRVQAEAPDVQLLRFHDGHVEQHDPALATAIAQADVLFITLINIRELADWLAEQVASSPAKAIFAFESMPEVMALNRVGEYRISGGRSVLPKPMQAILRLITRGRDEDTLYAYTRLTRVASKLLALMPAKLKDFRTWLSVNIYWNQPDAANITQMIRLILRDCLERPLDVAPVAPIPTMGCFHPAAEAYFADPGGYLKWYRTYLAENNRRPTTGDRRATSDERRGTDWSARSFIPSLRRSEVRRGAGKAVNRSADLDRPLVALIAFRKHVVQHQRYHGELIAALEAEGLAVLPIFVSGIELHVAVREWIAHAGSHTGGRSIDLLINSMGFSLVGGPAGSTSPGRYREQALQLLGNLDVPYMITQPLQMQNEQQWREQGVAPMQAVIMYDLPEMDGSIAPVTLGAVRGQEIVATPDRLARAARLAAGWVRLRHLPNAAKRIALVLYNYPPGLGKVGTAALLDVPASLLALLHRLRDEGYTVGELPATPDELARRIAAVETDRHSGELLLNDRANGQHEWVLSTGAYRQAVPAAHAGRVDGYWGAPPGDIAPVGRDGIRIDGFQFGNIFVGVQPPMGVPGDPMRLLFDRDFTPHHQYVAFYRWLSQVWRADAVVHVGMHGTAEWMPGLQLGLTAECWPDLLLGELPHLYLYPLNNPAEALIARRRGYAAIVSHGVPPYARAGLYKQLAQMRVLLDEYDNETGREGDKEQQSIACAEQRELPELPELPRASGEPEVVYRERARAYLDALEQRLILDGLHIFGQAPSADRGAALVEAALDVPRDGQPGLSQRLAAAGVGPQHIPAVRARFVRQAVLGEVAQAPDVGAHRVGAQAPGHRGDPGVRPDREMLRDILEAPWAAALAAHGRAILQGLAQMPGELDALVRGLGGRYIAPAPGADPVRAGAAALPSGRNIHGIDPWRLPTDAALARGQAMAEQLLARHRSGSGGNVPETVAMTLWAIDTIKSEGESIAVVLALVGARPERDGQGKIWRHELIPLAELGRPRIDLLLDISSVFRDTFQLSLDLLDDLFRRAAKADEPEEQNFIRAHALEMAACGQTWEQATARIFTQAPGLYGAGVDMLIDESSWETADDLADAYLRRSGHTYGGGRLGVPAPETLRGLLGTVGHVFQAIDSVEYGLTDLQHYYGHSGAIQLAAGQTRGEAIALTYAESYTGQIRLSGVQELLAIETRAKTLNPRWYEAMLAHGHAGAAEIGNRFTYMLGWGAITGTVENWVYDGMAATFVLDEAMRQRIEAANPQAARNAVARLLEARGRGLWQADDATIDRLQAIYGDLEDRLEGQTAA